MQLGRYELRAGELNVGQNDNYSWSKLPVDVSKNGEDLGHDGAGASLLHRRKAADVGSRHPPPPERGSVHQFAGMSEDGQKAVIQAYVFPLVSWIWIGYWVVLFGTIICLIPSKTRLIFPRTEVVGIAGKHAEVED